MPQKDFQHLHISSWTMVRFFGIILLLVILYMIRDIAAVLFFAVIVASAFEPAIEWLKGRRVPRLLSVITIYLVVALALFFTTYLVFPLLSEELQNVAESYPEIRKQVLFSLERAKVFPLGSVFSDNIEGLFGSAPVYLGKLGGSFFEFASAVFGGIFSFLMVVVFSFYLAIQERGIESFLRFFTPLAHEPYIMDLWGRAQRKLGRWLRAQLFLGALVGVLIFFGLTILGVEHAFLFAVIAAILEIIPVAGPILAAVPAVAVTFFVSPFLGVMTAALYVVVQQIESHVIIPVVMKKTIGLSPLMVVLALLIGAKLGGIFGILLSVPVTVILAEFVNDWDKKKRELIPG